MHTRVCLTIMWIRALAPHQLPYGLVSPKSRANVRSLSCSDALHVKGETGRWPAAWSRISVSPSSRVGHYQPDETLKSPPSMPWFVWLLLACRTA